MNNRLSHSAITKYQTCPTQYKYHYVDKLRSTTMSAALLFGTAIDKSVEVLVKTKSIETAKAIFNDLWTQQIINNKMSSLRNSSDIVYSNSDYDENLLNKQMELEHEDWYKELNQIVEEKKEKGWEKLSNLQKISLNIANWEIAKVRGHLMLEAINKYFLPKIKKVISTQEQIDLNNGNGDSVIGFVDMVAEYEGYETPIIFDFKTSTRPYERDSVKTSAQLALYMHALSEKYKTRTAGYIVLSKIINKNKVKTCKVCGNVAEKGSRHKTCNFLSKSTSEIDNWKETRCNGEFKEVLNPSAFVDVIIDEIPLNRENIIIENSDTINNAIKTGIFPKNFNSCFAYNKPCEFYDKCFNNSDKGLVKNES